MSTRRPTVLRWRTALAIVCGWLLGFGLAHAQPVTTGTLRVTVVDQTGAVIVGATVTASPAGAPAATAPTPVTTVEGGVATITGLAPGQYVVNADFPGFEKRILPNVRIRAGDNRQVAMLAIQ